MSKCASLSLFCKIAKHAALYIKLPVFLVSGGRGGGGFGGKPQGKKIKFDD